MRLFLDQMIDRCVADILREMGRRNVSIPLGIIPRRIITQEAAPGPKAKYFPRHYPGIHVTSEMNCESLGHPL